MKILQVFSLVLLGLPLGAQAWDMRVEASFPAGQNLPQSFYSGNLETVSGHQEKGNGFILTASHRIIRVGPVLKFEGTAEYAQWHAGGQIQQGAGTTASRLEQKGLGLGVNAQFWLPFTGFAAELGLIERFHAYTYQGGGASQRENLVQPWLRAGLRWNLPFPGLTPYLAVSYQVPITKDGPVARNSTQDLPAYLAAQGGGQEFDRLWSLGVGLSF